MELLLLVSWLMIDREIRLITCSRMTYRTDYNSHTLYIFNDIYHLNFEEAYQQSSVEDYPLVFFFWPVSGYN